MIGKTNILGNINTVMPDGATVTPVDDYAIWLECAELPNTYGSLANVIADTTAMETLCNNLNALRYMVRSASTILPEVLADADWIAGLKACAYATQVPTMTGYTTPSGVVSASSYSGSQWPYNAFANSSTYFWKFTLASAAIAYTFLTKVWVFSVGFSTTASQYGIKTFSLQGSSDGVSYTDLLGSTEAIKNTSVQLFTLGLLSSESFNTIRLNISRGYAVGDTRVRYLQFYGLDLN